VTSHAESTGSKIEDLFYPELRSYERAETARMLSKASETPLDLIEWALPRKCGEDLSGIKSDPTPSNATMKDIAGRKATGRKRVDHGGYSTWSLGRLL
jgi:hypothetical protein